MSIIFVVFIISDRCKDNQQGISTKMLLNRMPSIGYLCRHLIPNHHHQHHHHYHRNSKQTSTFLLVISIHIVYIIIFLHQLTNNYVQAFSYWRRLGPLSSDLKLGTSCRNSLECLLFVPNSQCDCEKGCVCQPYYILYNQTMCLPASLLGYACSVDEQCTAKVAHAECTNGLCQCKSNYLPLRRDKCLPPAMSGDFCLKEQQCLLGNKYSHCKYIIPRIYGKCRCKDGYHQTNDKKCLPTLRSECDDSLNECEQVIPNSFCAKYSNSASVCQCKPGYIESDDHLSCQPMATEPPEQIITDEMNNEIDDADEDEEEETPEEDESKKVNTRAVSLGKACNQSEECQLRDPYSQCVDGFCECIKRDGTCSSHRTGCYNDTFQCRNGQCVSWYFVCDNNKNCHDGSDESECKPFNCPKEAFQCDSDGKCLPRSVVCNGKLDCADGSDEARCQEGKSCDKHAWQCKSGQCLPQYAFCNAVPDCPDGSDEDESICETAQTCPNGTYTCSNRVCRSTAILCSGVDGCGDNSDEEQCQVCYCPKP